MAKIENYTLHILQEQIKYLEQDIISKNQFAEQAQNSYDRIINEIRVLEQSIKNVQNSIATLTAPKKKAKKDD